MKARVSIQLVYFLALVILTTACGFVSDPESSQQEGVRTLSVMTHDSFSISEQLLENFQAEHGVEVRFLKSGDAGTTVNKAILAKDKPLADVLYGVDNTYLSRALKEDIFEPYRSPRLSAIDDNFKLDMEYGALPVDFGDVCLNFDKSFFEDHGFLPPENLDDLLDSQYKALVVVENPATSSPGLAFLLATIGYYGDPGYLEYWQGLVENDVLVVNDWEVAYNQEFTRSGGSRPIVVSYGSSPPFEVIYSETPITESPTAAVVSDGACFRQIEFIGILKGTQNRDLAEKWIDFMLSPEFQEEIPLQMFVFPVNGQAKLNDVFEKYLAIPENPASVSYEDIAVNREKWINEWTQLVLR
ncbi:MAG TPA: thiamine ABC transporter substrate-binding protein [Anaerolineales bacterium]|nr:thiamine ABC transporter substrate-binding protein [Anaerolineales bacterium]